MPAHDIRLFKIYKMHVICSNNSQDENLDAAKKFFLSNAIDPSDFKPFEECNDEDQEKDLLEKPLKQI